MSNEAIGEVIKKSATFEGLPEELVSRIASCGSLAHYHTGQTIYEVGTAAEDVFVIIDGSVQHSFDPGMAVASDLVKTVGRGGLFGWAALLKPASADEPRYRLAKTVSLGETDVLVIRARDLIELLNTVPGAKERVIHNLTELVRHMYGFMGLVKVHDRFVPAHLPRSEPGESVEYDTFAF